MACELLVTHSRTSSDLGELDETLGFSKEVSTIFDDLGAPLEVVRWLENQAESGWAIVTQISSPMLHVYAFEPLEEYLESKAHWLSSRGAKMKIVQQWLGAYVVVIAGLTENDCTVGDIENQESLLRGFLSVIRAESPIGPNIYMAYAIPSEERPNSQSTSIIYDDWPALGIDPFQID